MFNICFCADEKYVKYAAAMMFGIVKNTNVNKSFKDFFTLDSINLSNIASQISNNTGGGGKHPL